MKNSRHPHSHNRGSHSFDNHAAKAARKTGGRIHKERIWRFFEPKNNGICPFAPHFRQIARAIALDGKHVRTVEEPARSAHGKEA